MARNHEKSLKLHQWARLKSGFDSDNRRRPGHTKCVSNGIRFFALGDYYVIKEISKYTSEISNPDLADDMSKVRELNDRINKL